MVTLGPNQQQLTIGQISFESSVKSYELNGMKDLNLKLQPASHSVPLVRLELGFWLILKKSQLNCRRKSGTEAKKYKIELCQPLR